MVPTFLFSLNLSFYKTDTSLGLTCVARVERGRRRRLGGREKLRAGPKVVVRPS